MTCPHILTNVKDNIQIIEFNRVEKKNAITNDMYQALKLSLEEAEENTDVHVILLRGQGDIFTAGNDLADFNNRPKVGPSFGHQFLRTLQQVKKPIIAEVEGLAIGVGVTLLLHCDLVYVAEQTRLRLPFVNLGLCPEAGSSLLLPLKAGHRAASELILLGDFFTATEAVDHGIANRVLSEDDIHAFTWQQAIKLAAQDPTAITESKKLLKAQHHEASAQRIEEEAVVFKRLLASENSRKMRAKTLEHKN